MQYLKQSTSATVLVGPVLDADGAAVTGAVIGDFRLAKNGTVTTMAGNTISHSHNGCYLITLTTSNTDTLDRLSISVGNTSYGMTVFRYTVLTANQYDALITNGIITPAAIEAALVNEGDATALLQAIADKIAGDLTAGDLTALAIVSAIKADATLAQMISRIDVATSSRLASSSYTAPPSASTNATAVRSELTTELARIDVAVSSRLASGSYSAPPTAATIADAVWDEPTVDHTSTGSFGYVIGIFFSLIEFVTGWRFTAKAVELAGGNVTVIAAPISAEDVERVLGSTIRAFTGETGTVSVTIRDSNQALIDLTGKTLRMVFSINGNVVHRIVHADLDVAGSVVTFSKSLAITGGPGEVDWSLFEVGKDALAHGVMYVNKIPY